MSERITLFAHVLLPLPVPKAYTYRVPVEWNDNLEIGQRVVVQFGPRKIYAGIVLDFTDQPPEKYQASYILEILDENPLVTPVQLKFWEWMARYYMCYQGEVMAAALPAGYRLQSESVVVLNPDFQEEDAEEMDEKEWQIIYALQQKKQLKIEEAATVIGLKTAMKYIKSLYLRGIIYMQEEIRENFRPKTETYLRMNEVWNDEEFAKKTLDTLEKKAPKQASVILALLGMGKGEFSKKILTNNYGIESSHIKTLEKKGLLDVFEKRTERYLQHQTTIAEFELTEVQREAVSLINQSFQENKPAVLFGITGSGKTYVYIHFIREQLKQGKQILYLLPEVALTEHLVSRLSEFFGEKMAVWHNYFSGSERTEIYESIKNGSIQILVGARSALFAPFKNLGLIVIDEEHETSFKQFEKRPHYHGRDSALYLAGIWKCNVLMGSATPSYEVMHACEAGKMTLVPLKKRYSETQEPEIEILHLGEAKRQNKMKDIFSLPMLEEIQRQLDSKGQVILFQNRKGYVPYISCDFCGFTSHCINCDIALTYYKSLKTQKCNYCGYTQDPPAQCPACGSNSLSMRGFGTERIAEELSLLFPDARISRFDQESIRKRSDFQKILNGFENGSIDILVGTQLLSKGLDFKNVGLVAVPDADMLINIPDFRSHERAFQQLHQVAGRSGRGTKRGKVMVQTYQAAHPVIQALVENDYNGLAKQELEMRKMLLYPPFSRLIKIIFRHKENQLVHEAAHAFGNTIKKVMADRVVGPQPPVVSKVRNYYIQQMLVKMDPTKDNIGSIKKYLTDVEQVLRKTPEFRSVRLDFDVDPQ